MYAWLNLNGKKQKYIIIKIQNIAGELYKFTLRKGLEVINIDVNKGFTEYTDKLIWLYENRVYM